MTSTTLQRCKLTPTLTGFKGGSGPPLVLVHGVGLRAEAWNRMLPVLMENYSIVAVDMPGHGGSDVFSQPSPKLADYSQRLAEVLDILDEPVAIVGHSMGALIAMDMAIRFGKRVAFIVALNAVYRRSSEAATAVRNRAKELETSHLPDPSATLERWFGPSPDGDMKQALDECKEWLSNANRDGYRQAYSVFAHEDGPGKAGLDQIKCPALFVTGSQEPNSTPAMSVALASGVAKGRAKIIEGAKHMMPMTHGQEVCKAIVQFDQEIRGEHDVI